MVWWHWSTKSLTPDEDNLCSHFCGVQVGFCCLSQAAHMDEDLLAGALSLPCLLGDVPVTGESAEQKQDDFKTTIIYCASCHCKLWLKVLFLLRHSSFLLQALPLNSADILKRTGTEGVQWGLGSISRQTRLKWLQAQCAFLPGARRQLWWPRGLIWLLILGRSL